MQSPASELRQGDYFADVTWVPVRAGAKVTRLETPRGVVVLTQCCDLARRSSSYAHVAVVVELD